MKYLIQKGNIYWIRRLIHNIGEINFSLKTKDYNASIVRLNFVNYHIERILYQNKGLKLTIQEIRILIKKYVDYITHPDNEYCDEIGQREQELNITIGEIEYKDHSTPALKNEYAILNNLINNGNLEDMSKKVDIVLDRTNIQNEVRNLQSKEKEIFIWEFLKAEREIIFQEINRNNQRSEPQSNSNISYSFTNQQFQPFQQETQQIEVKPKFQPMSITELTSRYIGEQKDTKDWGQRNEDDILNDCDINSIKREDFLYFRNDILRNFLAHIKSNDMQKKLQQNNYFTVKKKILKKLVKIQSINILEEFIKFLIGVIVITIF